MAQPVHAYLCIIVLILAQIQATLAGMESGLPDGQTGWLQVFDSKNDISFHNTVDFINGTTTSIDASLPMGTTWAYPVMDDTNSVTSGFKMTNASGSYSQDILSWGRLPSDVLPYYCAPYCIWLIDEHGFSVVVQSKVEPQFIVSWFGPV